MTHAHESATSLLETIPLIMGTLRYEIRGFRPSGVSVPQFRVLVYLSLHEGAMLSQISDHISLMRPTMSKMVDGLVRRGWVWRQIPPENRRCVNLGLTEDGKAVMNQARDEARRKMSELLENLTVAEQKTVQSALQMLHRVFSQENSASPNRKEN
jgi:DNA-binding MarR family transcriptional regulator